MSDNYVATFIAGDLILDVVGPFPDGVTADRFVELRNQSEPRDGQWLVRTLLPPTEWEDWEQVEALELHRLR